MKNCKKRNVIVIYSFLCQDDRNKRINSTYLQMSRESKYYGVNKNHIRGKPYLNAALTRRSNSD